MTLKHKIQEALSIANLAPSSHNCQPWQIVVIEDRIKIAELLSHRSNPSEFSACVLVGIDSSRKIGALQAHEIEMGLSVGAFSYILTTLLELDGLELVEVTQESQRSKKYDINLKGYNACYAIKNNEIQRNKTPYNEFVQLVQTRQTNRGVLTQIPSETHDIHSLLQTDENSCAVNDSKWLRISSKSQIQSIASLMKTFGERDFSDKKAWSETFEFIDFSNRNGNISGRGFNIQQLMGPLSSIQRLVYRTVLSPKIMPITNYFGLPKQMAKQLSELIIKSDSIVCLVSKEKKPKLDTAFECGKSMMKLWLSLTKRNISLHPVSILVQHNDIKAKLQETLCINDNIIFIARIGKVEQTSERPLSYRYRDNITECCQWY